MINRIKTWWDNRTNPQAALSVFDKSLKKLDKIDKRISKQQDKVSDAHANANAECDALIELYNVQEQKARERKKEARKARDIKVSECWAKGCALSDKERNSQALRAKLNELNSI